MKANYQSASFEEQQDIVDCKGKGLGAMKGAILMGRYKVVEYLDQGSFGYIFTISDLNNDPQNDQDLVLKIGDDIEAFQEEIVTLKKLDVVQKRIQEQNDQEEGLGARQVVTKLI